MNYRLAPHVTLEERDGEHFLSSPAPLVVLRLNQVLAGLIGRGSNGFITGITTAEQDILEQLANRGLLVRVARSPEPAVLPVITIIIPVKDRAEELRRCLASLDRLTYPRERFRVIVVDDGSSDASPAVAAQAGALVVPSGGTGRGPAAARNAGARHADGDILAFIDSDCTASSGWLDELVPAFTDRETVAVGGQVDGLHSASAVDRYEAVMSSLSLGGRERQGNRGNDTFYLPSCNLLVRRSAFLAVGGFADQMHVGEDVDLTWRLRDAGWTIVYRPVGRICHEHRSTLRSFMSRRFDYGTSEGQLQQLHPLRRKRMVIPPLLLLMLLLCLAAPCAGWWLLAPAAILLTTDVLTVRYRLARRGFPLAFGSVCAGRLRAMGSLAYYLSYHLVRYYALPLIAFALLDSRGWLFFGAVLGVAACVDHAVRKPRLSLVRFTGIYLLEQLAYGTGVFRGCLHSKCFTSYRVTINRQPEWSV